MSVLGKPSPLRYWLLRATGMASECRQIHVASKSDQGCAELPRCHGLEGLPMGLLDRDHHASVCAPDFIRDVVARHLGSHALMSVLRAQRRLDS